MSKATCKTCGAQGPPWHHKPSISDKDGVGDPGHRMEQTNKTEASEIQAKKYPMPGKLKGTIYGNPDISSMMASFECNVVDLINSRPNYKDGSKALEKHWDAARLDLATRIMQLLERQRQQILSEVREKVIGEDEIEGNSSFMRDQVRVINSIKNRQRIDNVKP